MSKKLNYFLRIILIFILMACIGCGNAEENADKNAVFSLSELQNKDEAGEFQYKDIPFGSSSEEVTQQIPKELEKMEAENSSAVSFYSKESFEFYGCDAFLFLDFNEDKLESVKVQFELKEGEEQFQKILDDLTELYGEPEISGGEGEIFTSEIYSWGKGTTRLQAILMKTESTESAVLGVFKMN